MSEAPFLGIYSSNRYNGRRPGPIQICNTRFAGCNINKKTKFSSGNVTITDATLHKRVSALVILQSSLRNVNLVYADISLNGYGQRSGGPYGYGSSPKNTF